MIAVPNDPAIRCRALVRAVARGISWRGTAFIAASTTSSRICNTSNRRSMRVRSVLVSGWSRWAASWSPATTTVVSSANR
jgi:hypothetical protein